MQTYKFDYCLINVIHVARNANIRLNLRDTFISKLVSIPITDNDNKNTMECYFSSMSAFILIFT